MSLPSESNCKYYADFKCKECANEFIVNDNLYFTKLKTGELTNREYSSIITYAERVDYNNSKVC